MSNDEVGRREAGFISGGYVSVEGGDDNKKSDNLSPEG
jgi:hypothetical protein